MSSPNQTEGGVRLYALLPLSNSHQNTMRKSVRTYMLHYEDTVNAATSIKLPRSGTIKQVLLSHRSNGDVATGFGRGQVAINVASGLQASDLDTPTGVLAHCEMGISHLAAGNTSFSHQSVLVPCNQAISENDSIFLHYENDGANHNCLNALIFVEE